MNNRPYNRPINGFIFKQLVKVSLIIVLTLAYSTIALTANSAVYSKGIGDGLTDDTAVIQAEINGLNTSAILDGQNRLYLVGTLFLKSDMTIRNFRFLARPGSIAYTSPVTIDGNGSAKTNITIRNVHINGNRSFQTGLITTYEDGGRSCFRIVRAAANIWIIDSSASYCATDGLIVYSQDVLTANDRTHRFQDIHVVNSRFEYNRRHGSSGDSLANVTFYGTTFNNNGNDINGGIFEGDRGARLHGYTYGSGIAIEGYGLSFGVTGVSLVNCTAIGNASAGISFSASPSENPSTRGFVARRNIRVEGCTIDSGVEPKQERIALYVAGAVRNKGVVYTGVSISNSVINGLLIFGAVNALDIVGNTITSPLGGFYGVCKSCTNIRLQANESNATGGLQQQL